MTSLTSTPELMSALADGQLRDDELARAWLMLEKNDDAATSWNDYHLIGDVLRSPVASAHLAVTPASVSFVNRFNLKLHAKEAQAQATDSWAEPLPARRFSAPPHVPLLSQRGAAANDAVFRWKLLAGFASLAAVLVITWTAVGPAGLATVSPQLAQNRNATQVLVASPQGIVVQDARLNELLAAHKQLGSVSALQAPPGFLQSAAFETSVVSGR